MGESLWERNPEPCLSYTPSPINGFKPQPLHMGIKSRPQQFSRQVFGHCTQSFTPLYTSSLHTHGGGCWQQWVMAESTLDYKLGDLGINLVLLQLFCVTLAKIFSVSEHLYPLIKWSCSSLWAFPVLELKFCFLGLKRAM